MISCSLPEDEFIINQTPTAYQMNLISLRTLTIEKMNSTVRIQIWTLVVTILIGASMALSDPQISVLSTDSSSPGLGEVSLATQDRKQSAVLHSLQTLAMRIFSFEGGGQDLHWPVLEWNWRLVLAVVLGSVGASLCSAGGVGGGGLFIPLFNLLLGFDAKSAAALSNFMILGGSMANVGWNLRLEHPHHAGHPLVDFDVALLLQPNMLLGISIGVICNIVFPSWFIIFEFIIVLGYITRRSFRSGMLRWRNETILAEEKKGESESSIEAQEQGEVLLEHKSSTFNVLTGCVLEESDVAPPEVLKRLDSKSSRQNLQKALQKEGSDANEPLLGNQKQPSHFPFVKLFMLTVVWLVFFAVQVLRGGKSSPSILNVEPCKRAYWLLTISQVPLAILLTGWAGWHVHHTTTKNSPPELQPEEWDLVGPRAFVIFPSMALLAGFLGGMLGIGGGMIINPLLIEIGMHPQLTAATTAFMVFFSSSLSVVQFWLLGRLPLDFALLFAGICFVSSLIGLRIVQQAISKFGRPSIIVFAVSIVLGVSAILTIIFGGLEVWNQYTRGEYMGFHKPC
ncbi:hypothetical protein KC19_4G252700 [Ceratodon purpureus]|uniref:Sulfite exporter TauE/SafE family protein n=1 Tax=Ceratodon purpureus TaxID=3225 RepID=A0A8T0IFY3_CERPU|nr:hypothetical protein KC19_4G252700 [Ceratodon purpureus]